MKIKVFDVMRETPVSLKDVAARFGVTLKTVYAWASRTEGKRLETVKVGGKRVTTAEAVQRFLSEDKPQPTPRFNFPQYDHEAALRTLRDVHGVK